MVLYEVTAVYPVWHLLLDAGYILSEELSGSGTFYIIECSAENPCVVHLFLGLATPLSRDKRRKVRHVLDYSTLTNSTMS